MTGRDTSDSDKEVSTKNKMNILVLITEWQQQLRDIFAKDNKYYIHDISINETTVKISYRQNTSDVLIKNLSIKDILKLDIDDEILTLFENAESYDASISTMNAFGEISMYLSSLLKDTIGDPDFRNNIYSTTVNYENDCYQFIFENDKHETIIRYYPAYVFKCMNSSDEIRDYFANYSGLTKEEFDKLDIKQDNHGNVQ